MRVTRHFPPREGIDAMDHATLHPGIWLAFGDINGSDLWRGKNEVRHLRFVDEPSVIDEGVEFSVESEYVVGSEAICRERSHHKILRRPSGYLFLFDAPEAECRYPTRAEVMWVATSHSEVRPRLC